MKKLVVLLVVVMLVAYAGTTMAEGMDLTGLSDDEIVALLGRVQVEIVAWHIEGTATLSGGTYIAGEDIPLR